MGNTRETSFCRSVYDTLNRPGFVEFYRSNAGYVGIDELTIEVKFPNGRNEVQNIKVTVGNAPTKQQHLICIWMICWAISPRLFFPKRVSDP